jgi:hypothetical protein
MRLPLKSQLYYKIGRHLPFLKIRPPDVDRKQVMTLRPGKNSLITSEKKIDPETKEETGETILIVPQNDKVNRVTKMVAKWMNVPNERKIELDEVGGYVWDLCDGNHTVETIVKKTSQQYKMSRREAEVSVTMFLQMLHERSFIGFYKKTGKKA